MLRDTLQRLTPSAVVRRAVFIRIENPLMQRQEGFALFFPEGDGQNCFRAYGSAVSLVDSRSPYEAFRLHDLANDALPPDFAPVGGSHSKAIGAARMHIHLADRGGVSARSPPSDQMLRVG